MAQTTTVACRKSTQLESVLRRVEEIAMRRSQPTVTMVLLKPVKIKHVQLVVSVAGPGFPVGEANSRKRGPTPDTLVSKTLHVEMKELGPLLVFRKKGLYLIITQKLTFMKSGGFRADFTC